MRLLTLLLLGTLMMRLLSNCASEEMLVASTPTTIVPTVLPTSTVIIEVSAEEQSAFQSQVNSHKLLDTYGEFPSIIDAVVTIYGADRTTVNEWEQSGLDNDSLVEWRHEDEDGIVNYGVHMDESKILRGCS